MITVRLSAIEQTGDLTQIVRQAPELARQAREMDDEFLAGFLALSVPLSYLLADQPERALDLLEERRQALPRNS